MRSKYLFVVFLQLSSNVLSASLAHALDSIVHGMFDGLARRFLYGMEEDEIALLDDWVLNFPSYANWTDDCWSLRVHGNVHKRPPYEFGVIDRLSSKVMLGTSLKDLQDDEAETAREVLEDVFVSPQRGKLPAFDLVPASLESRSGHPDGGNSDFVNALNKQEFTLQYPTTNEGDFDDFVMIRTAGIAAGYAATAVQKVSLTSSNAKRGNATSYLVPAYGLTILADIDDILRITKIWQPLEMVLNTLARPFVPWMDMPKIFEEWESRFPDAHFHYFSTAPEYIARRYMEFIYEHFPEGSYEARPLNFSNWKQTLHVRRWFLERILETFPKRKFILLGDTSNE